MMNSVLFLHDSAPIQKSWEHITAIRVCGFEELKPPTVQSRFFPKWLFPLPKSEETHEWMLVLEQQWTSVMFHRHLKSKTKTYGFH